MSQPLVAQGEPEVLAVLAAPLVALVAVCLTLESSVVLRAPMA